MKFTTKIVSLALAAFVTAAMSVSVAAVDETTADATDAAKESVAVESSTELHLRRQKKTMQYRSQQRAAMPFLPMRPALRQQIQPQKPRQPRPMRTVTTTAASPPLRFPMLSESSLRSFFLSRLSLAFISISPRSRRRSNSKYNQNQGSIRSDASLFFLLCFFFCDNYIADTSPAF